MITQFLTHEFVEYLPDNISEGVIYISIPFATATHLCCCGCKKEAVTPISPTDWSLIFDGKTVSLNPSIGNWSFPCQSHYWIEKNRISWSDKWSDRKVKAGRNFDRIKKDNFYSKSHEVKNVSQPTPTDNHQSSLTVLQKLLRWLSG